VVKFDVVTGKQEKGPGGGPPAYTKVFADALIAEATRDPKIVAITAAMPGGTGLDIFEKVHPSRMFDVGIAEQHAVTFAAGLAAEGFRPSAPSIRPSSSAPTTRWSMTSRSRTCPSASAWTAPAWSEPTERPTPAASTSPTSARSPTSWSWRRLTRWSLPTWSTPWRSTTAAPSPSAIRAATAGAWPIPASPERLEIGKGRVVREGKTVAILSLGTRLEEAEKAAEQLEAMGLSTTVADLRFAKPLDEALIRKLLTTHEVAVTVEEAAVGGFGAHVLTLASDEGLIDGGLKLRTMRLPDIFQDQDSPAKQYDQAALNARTSSTRC
jgi:1-deoxy-D-xylulose-5-phosphate synthase